MRFKNPTIDNCYAADTILDFINYAEANIHYICRCDGSYRLYKKCLYVK